MVTGVAPSVSSSGARALVRGSAVPVSYRCLTVSPAFAWVLLTRTPNEETRMSEREQDQAEDRDDANGQSSDDEWVREVEEDPSTAGSPEEPGDDLRGG